jgi:rod shape determining protein RodA
LTDWSTPRSAPATFRREGIRRERLSALEVTPVRRMDYVLLCAVAGLLVLGVLLVWSATKPANAAAGLDPNAYLKKDLLNVVVAVIVGGAAALIDYRTLRAYTPLLYAGCIFGLLLVLVPHIGIRVNGAKSWINLGGGFELQPSEFTKLALVLGLAMLLAERQDRETTPRNADIALGLALAGVPLLLILVEPDLGVVLVCLALIIGVLAISGAGTRWLVALFLLGVVGSFLAVHLHLLKTYQLQRLTAFTNPRANATTTYNTHEAAIAIGSGGLTGKGLFHGTQTNGQFVPENQTDFIFTVAGEELGFAGSAIIIALIGVVLWRGIRVAARTEDPFGRLVAVGIVSWLGFQSFENIGMTLGIMPVTGIPLPFISYGGSALFANMIAIGLLQNVHARATRVP